MSHFKNASATVPIAYFSTIQVLRGVAAMLVVVFHLVDAERIYGRGSMLLDGVAREGFAGVDVFFVISGFVMATITTGQFGSIRNAGAFLAKRAARIFPLYWLFTAAVVMLLLLFPTAIDASVRAKSFIASFLLWPQAQFPLLQVGWTLTYEVFFYVMVAAALVTVAERRVTLYFAAWAFLIGALQFAPIATPWQTVVTSPMGWEFIAGALVGLWWKKVPDWAGRPIFWLGVVAFVLCAITVSELGLYDQDPLRRTLLFGSSSALIVLGLVVRERRGAAALHPWLRKIGDASYSIYLSHLFVVTAAARAWGRSGWNNSPLTHILFIAGALVASALVGLICYRVVERPLIRFTSGRLSRRAAIASESAA